MIAKAAVRFVRISPRKVRYVIDLIRRKRVLEAHAILNGSPRRAGELVRKLLNQAVDAAEKNAKVGAAGLVISKITADGGPMMKRFRAASMGRASVIRKRTSHILLELDLAGGKAIPAAPKEKKKPAKSMNQKTVGAK